MVKPAQLVGRRLALLLQGEDEQGQDDWAVFTGTVREDGGRLFLDREQGALDLQKDWIERVQPVEPEVSEVLLGADYVLSLSVGTLPDDVSAEGLEPTGLKWPPSSDA